METKQIAIKFAIYLAENWSFEGDRYYFEDCDSNTSVNSSQCNCLNIQTIDEIYDEWIKDINTQTQ